MRDGGGVYNDGRSNGDVGERERRRGGGGVIK